MRKFSTLFLVYDFKKNLQLIISLLTSLTGLVFIYILDQSTTPDNLSVTQLTADKVGSIVTVSGEISKRTQSNAGHVFLTLDKKLQVPIFSQLKDSLDEKVLGAMKVGTRISVTGVVDTYQNNLQVVPRAPTDIEILGG